MALEASHGRSRPGARSRISEANSGRAAIRVRVVVTGRVQGVWFRDTCRDRARTEGVAGFVRNRADGAVEAEFEGPDARGRANGRLVPDRSRPGPGRRRRGRADRSGRVRRPFGSGEYRFADRCPGRTRLRPVSPTGVVSAPTIAAGRRGPVVPAIAHAEGLQVLRRQDHARLRAGCLCRRGPERLRQVERRRLRRVGARRPGRPRAARRQDGRRHLRGHVRTARARPRRGRADDRQHLGHAPDRVLRGHDHPHAVPHRRVGVHDQRRARAACSTSRSCSPTPVSAASST